MPIIDLKQLNQNIITLDNMTSPYAVIGTDKLDKILIKSGVSVDSMNLDTSNDAIHLPYYLKDYKATVNNATLILTSFDQSEIKINVELSQADTLYFADGFAKIENSRGKIAIGNLTLQTNKFYDLVNEKSITLNTSKISETASINNDDKSSIFYLDDNSVIIQQDEGNSGSTTFKFKVLRDSGLLKSASVSYVIDFNTDGTSADKSDISGNLKDTLTFVQNQKDAYIQVKVKGDIDLEETEQFRVLLSTAINGSVDINRNISYGIITNDDDENTHQNSNNNNVNQNDNNADVISNLSISSTSKSLKEGKTFTYTLKLDQANTEDIIIDYELNADSETDDADFKGNTSGSLTIPAGQISVKLNLKTNDDKTYESDEPFSIDFTSESDLVNIKTEKVSGKILNNDKKIEAIIEKPADIISNLSLSVDNAEKTEGSTFNYTLKLDKANTQPLTVNYSISNISDSPTDSNDFIGLTSGSVTFYAGETSKTISISTKQDSDVENDESFTINLTTNDPYVTLQSSSATGTITNDDVNISNDEFQISKSTTKDAQIPSISKLLNSNIITVWQDRRDSNTSIYGQISDMNGNSIKFSEFKVSSAVGVFNQNNPLVYTLKNGNFLVTWEDNRNGDWDIYGRIFSETGEAILNEFQINSETNLVQISNSITSFSNGNIMITWQDNRNGDWDIYGRIFSETGTPITSDIRINAYNAGWQIEPSSTTIVDDKAIIVWIDSRNNNARELYIRAFDPNGNPASIFGESLNNDIALKINSSYANGWRPDISSLSNGSFVIVWDKDIDYTDNIRGAIFSPSATSYSTQEIIINQSVKDKSGNPKVIKLQDGFFVVWQNYSGGYYDLITGRTFSPSLTYSSSYISDIYGQVFSNNGIAKTNQEIKIESVSTGLQAFPSIASDKSNIVSLVWQDSRNNQWDIYGKNLNIQNLPLSFIYQQPLNLSLEIESPPLFKGGNVDNVDKGGFNALTKSSPNPSFKKEGNTIPLLRGEDDALASAGGSILSNSLPPVNFVDIPPQEGGRINLNPNQFNLNNMTSSYLKNESILGNLNNNMLVG